MNFRKLATMRSTSHDKNQELGGGAVGRVGRTQDGHSAGRHGGKPSVWSIRCLGTELR